MSFLSASKLLKSVAVHHPVVLTEASHRAGKVQLIVADAITAFAGSMNFVYAHIVIFVIWMIWFEGNPWPTLTLVVSLEAIFLSTFVMIGQNRQAAFQQAKADHDYQQTETQLSENTVLTREIAEHTAAIRALTEALHTHFLPGTPPLLLASAVTAVIRAVPAAT